MKNKPKNCPHCGKSLSMTPKWFLNIRHFMGLTQRELAVKLGVKASHVAYLENGRRHPSPALLTRYMKVEVLAKRHKIADAKKVLKQAA
jgi:transcriptional regulator with XRE-family HTH domain